MSQTLFLIISLFGIFAALGTVLARNLVHAALYLIAFFFIIACQFVLLEAEFLAAIQVLVYIGAVAILMMFGIMLTRNVQGDETTSIPRGWQIPGVIVALAVFGILVAGISDHVGLHGRSAWRDQNQREPAVYEAGQVAPPRVVAINNMGKAVGDEMMTRFVIPFEVAGLLLTAALVGAIALCYREGDEGSPRLGAFATRPLGATDGSGAGSGHAGRDETTAQALTTTTR